MRTGTALGPVLAYFFRNSPILKGRPALTAFCGSISGHVSGIAAPVLCRGFDGNFGFEQAAYNVLASPLMVADVTHTPEYAGK